MQELLNLGVISYQTYVIDGHTLYFGRENVKLASAPNYKTLSLAKTSDKVQFIADLRNHQNGNTDYQTFCKDCAKSGVEKWTVDTLKMTCIYYDNTGEEMLIEKIPGITK